MRDSAAALVAAALVLTSLTSAAEEPGVDSRAPTRPREKAEAGAGAAARIAQPPAPPPAKPGQKAVPLPPPKPAILPEDLAIIEKLDLLLILDFLENLELFDEAGESAPGAVDAPGGPDGGATLSAPAGSKRYRP